jgi:hypothetical protein
MNLPFAIASDWSPGMLQLLSNELALIKPKLVVVIGAGNWEPVLACLNGGMKPDQITVADIHPDAVQIGECVAGRSTPEQVAQIILDRTLKLMVRKNQFLRRAVGAIAITEQVARLAGGLRLLADKAKGVTFLPGPLNNALETYLERKDAVLVLTPIHKPKGVTGEGIEAWHWKDREADLIKAKAKVYAHDMRRGDWGSAMPCVGIWRSKTHIAAPAEKLFTNRQGKDEVMVVTPVRKLAIPKWKPMTNEPIKPDSRIAFHRVARTMAIYYRNLWVHGLGSTDARTTFMITMDGAVMASVGIELDKVQRRREQWVYETYGAPAQTMRYKRLGKLMMMLLTCREAKEFIEREWLNSTDKIIGLRTTSLCKHQEHKVWRGVLRTTHKEQMPNGLWKLKGEANFSSLSFQETLAKWLAHDKNESEQRDV